MYAVMVETNGERFFAEKSKGPDITIVNRVDKTNVKNIMFAAKKDADNFKDRVIRRTTYERVSVAEFNLK